MDSESDSKKWLYTLPGILTGVAGVIGAIATLTIALHGGRGSSPESPKHEVPTDVSGKDTTNSDCIPPYVWRLAIPSDHVCVSEDSRKLVELENQRAAERRQAQGGAYGPDTCVYGYVWREAFKGDTYCVLPQRRDEVREENLLAIQRVKR